MSATLNEQQQWINESTGKLVVNGFLYYGVQGSDPVVNPVPIFADRDFTTPISNPQRTDATGRSENKVWLDVRYSLKLEDVNNVQLYQELDNGEAVSTFSLSTKAVTADFTVSTSENGNLIRIDASAGDVTGNLPATVTAGGQFEISFKRVDTTSNIVTIDGFGGETIETGLTSITIDVPSEAITLRSTGSTTGTSWFILSNNDPILLEKIASGVESNISSLEFLNLSSGFSEYLFLFWELDPIDDAVQFRLRTSIAADGDPFTTTNYTYSNIFTRSNDSNTVKASNLNSTTQLVIGGSDTGIANSQKTSGHIRLIAPAIDQDSFTTIQYMISGGADGNEHMLEFGSGHSAEAAPVLAFELFMSTGNIDSIQWEFYGTRI